MLKQSKLGFNIFKVRAIDLLKNLKEIIPAHTHGALRGKGRRERQAGSWSRGRLETANVRKPRTETFQNLTHPKQAASEGRTPRLPRLGQRSGPSRQRPCGPGVSRTTKRGKEGAGKLSVRTKEAVPALETWRVGPVQGHLSSPHRHRASFSLE